MLVLCSIDQGATWTKKLVATMQLGRVCTARLAAESCACQAAEERKAKGTT